MRIVGKIEKAKKIIESFILRLLPKYLPWNPKKKRSKCLIVKKIRKIAIMTFKLRTIKKRTELESGRCLTVLMMYHSIKLKTIKPARSTQKSTRSLIILCLSPLGCFLELKSNILFCIRNNSINHLYSNVERVNSEFFKKLKNDFPDITKNEIMLCGLIRINLSNKEIAVIRNITPKAVKMGKYRMKKRFELDQDDSLDEFIQNY